MTQVILADDHPLFLSALELTLQEAGIGVLGTAATGPKVLELAGRYKPDGALLDLCMPGMEGIACIERLSELHPAVGIVVVSAIEDQTAIHAALAAGALCFISKSVQPASLVHAVRAAIGTDRGGHRRKQLRATRSQPARNHQRDTVRLTRRELEILRLAATGSSNVQMAKLLWVTDQTIKFHLSNVYKKLGVPNRSAAAAAARELGLLELDDPRSAPTAQLERASSSISAE